MTDEKQQSKVTTKKISPVTRKTTKPAPIAKKKTARKTPIRKSSPAKPATVKTTSPKEEKPMTTKQTGPNFDQFAQQSFQGFEQASAFSKEFFDAFVQSGNIAANGYQELVKAGVSWSQAAAEQTASSFKDLMTCRSLNEFTEKQNAFTQSTLNHTLSGASQITEKYIKLCTDCAEPLNKQVGAAVEKATKKAA